MTGTNRCEEKLGRAKALQHFGTLASLIVILDAFSVAVSLDRSSSRVRCLTPAHVHAHTPGLQLLFSGRPPIAGYSFDFPR